MFVVLTYYLGTLLNMYLGLDNELGIYFKNSNLVSTSYGFYFIHNWFRSGVLISFKVMIWIKIVEF